MQAVHRPHAVAPLALVLPHPPLRRPSSLRSNAPSPRTPTCGSPVPFLFATNPNRKSTDSWNSYEEGDEFEHEWKSEHTTLLTRTLDALPSHLLTPYNGVPPANLLDKIARGVQQAKRPDEWPHSVRATRAKLLELARMRAKEAAQEVRPRVVVEEEDILPADAVLRPTDTNKDKNDAKSEQGKRPLYRQSSMDFMRSANLALQNNDSAGGRLSTRLQRAERIIAVPYHPYSRPRSGSPSVDGPVASRRGTTPSISPSTPSSTTLNSGAGGPTTARRPPVRRSSTLTLSSASSVSAGAYALSVAPLLDPRVQRIRRSDSFSSTSAKSDASMSSSGNSASHGAGTAGPVYGPYGFPQMPGPLRSLKRAPSYSAASARSSESSGSTKIESEAEMDVERESAGASTSRYIRSRKDSGSSDEEEKARGVRAKKARRGSPTPPPPSAPCSPSPVKPTTRSQTKENQRKIAELSSPLMTPVNVNPIPVPAIASPRRAVRARAPASPSPAPAARGTDENGSPSKATGAPRRPAGRVRANLQRNPSMFGPELPNPQPAPQLPGGHQMPSLTGAATRAMSTCPSSFRGQPVLELPPNLPYLAPTPLPAPALAAPPTLGSPRKRSAGSPPGSPAPTSPSPGSPGQRRLRRVKGTTIGERPAGGPARRISFGSLVAPSEAPSTPVAAPAPASMNAVLGSAFQLC